MGAKLQFDPLLVSLCERSVKLSQRSLIVIKGKLDLQVVLVYLMVKKSSSATSPSVLWCHKKEAEFPRIARKMMKSITGKLKSRKTDVGELSPLEIFLHSSSIQFCNYSDTQSILGNTYCICVLQDMECLTPNILCRVIETVQGGGAVVLLPGVDDLREFSQLDMDIHYKLTTHSHPQPNKYFNNRFLTSLSWCKSCVVFDKDMRPCHNELPGLKYKHIKDPSTTDLSVMDAMYEELSGILQSIEDASKPLPQLMKLCKTPDQARALLKLVDVVTEKHPRSVVSLTAGRGRGKSAVMGMAVAAAIDLGVNNIFVTSPSPHNLTAFFQMLLDGFDSLEYKDEQDYEIQKSTNPEFSRAIIRINVFRKHRQTVQYIHPSDSNKLHAAELVIIDEAAAIPLPHVQSMLGEHITIMSSTIAGYEGTGRSLSLKLLKELRNQSVQNDKQPSAGSECPRELFELTLSRSIRYADGDPVEEWLYKLLCLNATDAVSPATTCPVPHSCQLYYVNKSVLMSGTTASEQLLLQMQSLLVSSHYRNSPDDLQVLSDSAAHHLFVLLSPLPKGSGAVTKEVPPVLCVIQVCIEGGIDESRSKKVIRKGERPPGDLVPWNIATHFLQPSLTANVGARIIRIATHPHYHSMGYGSRALDVLQQYYNGKLYDALADDKPSITDSSKSLLSKLSDRSPEALDYLSVSYGITPQLYKFWHKSKFIPLYVGQTVNKSTGEHSCIMVRPVSNEEDVPQWISSCSHEFLRRFVELIGGPLRSLHPMLCYNIIRTHHEVLPTSDEGASWRDVECYISGHDLRRIEKYSKNIVDRHLISDLINPVANLYCFRKLPQLDLSTYQSALLIGSGLQFEDLIDVGRKLDLVPQSTLGNFNRAMRRVYAALSTLQEQTYADKLKSVVPDLLVPVDLSADQDLNKLAKETEEENPDLHFHKKRKHYEFDRKEKNVHKRQKWKSK